VVAPRPAKGRTGHALNPVSQPFRRDCQQISADPSERNASWMSAPLVVADAQGAKLIAPEERRIAVDGLL
jgi:hypothetical protein